MQRLADRVQGGGHDGGVHRGHEQAERDDGEDQAPSGMRIAGVGHPADVCCTIARDRALTVPAVLSLAPGTGAKIEHHDWLAYLNASEVALPPPRSARPGASSRIASVARVSRSGAERDSPRRQVGW